MRELPRFPNQIPSSLEQVVIYDSTNLLIVNKPPGVLVQGDQTNDPTIVYFLINELGYKLQKPYLATVHRLDRPVSGVLILAKSKKYASQLARELKKGILKRTYIALCHGRIRKGHQDITLYLRKLKPMNKVVWSKEPKEGFKRAVTTVQPLVSTKSCSLVALFPKTGRTHQLRVTLSYLGHPIVGDLRYGSNIELGSLVMLHAFSVEVKEEEGRVRAIAAIPNAWRVVIEQLCPKLKQDLENLGFWPRFCHNRYYFISGPGSDLRQNATKGGVPCTPT